jgi:hypothetical protein
MGKTSVKAVMIVGILLLFVWTSSGNNPVTILIGPYTQHSEADSIIVSWKTTLPTTQNEVHWGSSAMLGNVTSENTIVAKTFHQVKIEGLQAGLRYYYIVVSDVTESPLYTFWSASEPTETIRFIVYGDSRGGWDAWQSTLHVSQGIEKENPAFVLNTGDLVDNGRIAQDWVDFFNASPFVHNSTLYPVLGNHEEYGRRYFSFFSLPFNERWYSFDNGPVHFIGLDSNPLGAFRLAQYLWLLYDLWTNSQSFTIVFFHHPVYSSGNHGNATVLQKLWGPVFEHFQVDLVMNGHDHDYEHSIVNGITYIVTGGGGAPLYDVGHSPWTVYAEKTYHYCLLTVNSSTLTFEAKKPDGSVFDSFLLTK